MASRTGVSDGGSPIQLWSPLRFNSSHASPGADPQPRSLYSGFRGEGSSRKLSCRCPQGSLSVTGAGFEPWTPPDWLCNFGMPLGYWFACGMGLRTMTSLPLASQELVGEGHFDEG